MVKVITNKWVSLASLAFPFCYRAVPLGHSSSSLAAHVIGREVRSRQWDKTAAKAVNKAANRWYFLLSLLPMLLSYIISTLAFCWSMLHSLPRSMRSIAWTIRTGLAYRKLQTYHIDHESEEYVSALMQLHSEVGARLTRMCRRNGGVYIKAGQFAAAFGAVPREIRKELSQLEDKAAPRPYRQIRQVLLAELGPNADSLFSSFEQQAVAAASIAQVHRARLSTGEEVAVKLQYPGLKSSIDADLFLIKQLTWAARQIFKGFHLAWLYDELEKSLRTEMDFRTEIQNANKLADIVERERIASVHVPKMYDRFCSSRVVIMEWIQGTKITNISELNRQVINPRCVGLALVRLFSELTFVHGYVHGDPHPGNLMVRPKGRPSFVNWLLRGSRQPFELVLLDHGTYLTVPTEMRELFCQLWCSFVMRDKEVQRDICTRLGGERGAVVLPVLLTQAARNRAEEIAVQKNSGINNWSDMTTMMQSVSNDVVELLRINTVTRGVSSQLGISMNDRKRVSAWYARRGLPPRGQRTQHMNPSFNHLRYRLELLGVLSCWTACTWTANTAWRMWGYVLDVFAEAIFEA